MPQEAVVTRPELEKRLQELKQELASGEAQLAALDKKRKETSETMLRIVGAVQVLQELLHGNAEREETGTNPVGSSATHAANGLQPAPAESR